MIAKTIARDIIDYMNLMSRLKKLQILIKKLGDQIIEKISLHLVFFIGIGLTSLVAKALFKNFTTKKYYVSSWSRKNITLTHNKMY